MVPRLNVRRGEVVALLVAIAAVIVGWRTLRWGIDKGDPRRAMIRRIHDEASPTHDLVVVTDEAPELVAAAAPIPALWGTIPLRDLSGFRRLYVLAQTEAQLGPFEVRLGAPTETLAPTVVRWDLAGLATVVWELTDHLLDSAVVRRVGGRFDGPCTRAGNLLRCNSRDDWNHLRVEPHNMGGIPISCVWAHPQEQSQLVVQISNLPAARMLVGVIGMDDHAYFPGGAPVENRVRFIPTGGGPAIERVLVAPSKVGVTPYRIDLGGRGGTLIYSISTANAGARQFCFTGSLTR